MQDVEKLRENSGHAAHYFADRLAFTIGPVEFHKIVGKYGHIIIDSRDEKIYKEGHIPGAVSMNNKTFLSKKESLNKDELIVVYCYNRESQESLRLCYKLAKEGYRVMHLEGGFKEWAVFFEDDVEK